jgi:hypothetical protein
MLSPYNSMVITSSDLDVLADMKRKVFYLAGHAVRMDQGRTLKKVFESKPEGSRRR